MALIEKKQALARLKPRYRDVPYPELGGEIRFVEPTAAAWDEFDKSGPLYGVRMIVACAHGADGRLFGPGDINKLALWPRHMIERGAKAVLQMMEMLPDDGETAKNSDGGSPTPASPPHAD